MRALFVLVLACACGRLGFAELDNEATAPDAARATTVAALDAALARPCPGLDGRPDLNGNGVPDCLESMAANGQFATAVAPFTSNARATVSWSSADALGFASGSALVTDIVAATTVNGGSVISACIPAAPLTTYDVYAQYLMASGQPGGDANSAAWITIQTWTDAACTTPWSSISGGALGMTKDAWDVYRRTFTTASQDRAFQIELGVLKGATTSAVSAAFDNVLVIGG